MLKIRTHSRNNCKIFVTKPNENTRIKLVNKYIVPDTNVSFRQKAESLINIWTKFLGMIAKRQNRKKKPVHLLISLLIECLAIGLVLCHANLMIRWLQWLEKRWGAAARWWATAIFQLTELNTKANPPWLQYAYEWGCAKWPHKLYAERMRDAKARNHLKTHEMNEYLSASEIWRKLLYRLRVSVLSLHVNCNNSWIKYKVSFSLLCVSSFFKSVHGKRQTPVYSWATL